MAVIRILQVSSHYPAYLKQFSDLHPELTALPYREQTALLHEDAFGSGGVWKQALEGLGDLEVERVYCDVEVVQKTWAREQSVAYRNEQWMLDILRAQVRAIRPHILYEHGCPVLREGFLAALKEEMPALRVVSYQGVPIRNLCGFRSSDLVLSCSSVVLEPFRAAGMHTALLSHGFNPAVIHREALHRDRYPVTFIGSLGLASQGHHGRLELLDYLKRRIPMELFLEMEPPWRTLARAIKTSLKKESIVSLPEALRELPKTVRLYRKSRGPVYGRKMYQVLGDSSITLNSHIDSAGNKAVNMRLYEATGMGTCLVTDWKPNLREIFEIDREVVAYRTKEECEEKVRFLLEHPSERRGIAEAGQKRTLEEYNSVKLVRDLLPRLQVLIEKG